MYPDSIRALQADTLSASAAQRSDQLSASQIWQAAAAALDAYGGRGCAGPVAQEFGDHQETAAVRMRWARATLAVLDGQPAPRMRRIATACSPTLGLSRTPRARSAAGHGRHERKVTVMCTCKIYPDRRQPHSRTCSRHGR